MNPQNPMRIDKEREMSDIIECHGKKQTRKRHLPNHPELSKLVDLFVYYYSCDECGRGDLWCILCDQLNGEPEIIENYPSILGNNTKFAITNHLHRYHSKACKLYYNGYVMIYEHRGVVNGKNVWLRDVKIDCMNLMDECHQMIFLNQVDTKKYAAAIIEAANVTTHNERECKLLLRGSIDTIHCSNFCDWFNKFMESRNYKCTGCGMRYEDGLPELEVVAEHIYVCVGGNHQLTK